MSNRVSLEAALRERAEKMRKELTEWALEELLLGHGQRITVSIAVFEENTVEFKVENKVFGEIVKEEDLKIIADLKWYRGRGNIIKRLNFLLGRIRRSPEGELNMDCQEVAQFNTRFKRFGAPYRFRRSASSLDKPGEARYQLFKNKEDINSPVR